MRARPRWGRSTANQAELRVGRARLWGAKVNPQGLVGLVPSYTPVTAIGCPSAIAPPFGLTTSGFCSVSLITATTRAANASLSSTTPSSFTRMPGTSAPVESPSLAMPVDDGRRPDHEQVATPVSVETADQDPEELLPSLEPGPALDPERDL